MKRLCVLFILYCTLRSSSSADEVESKANDMAKAIAQQNKKVEAESDALEKAIDEKSKQVDTTEQEDKFEKASKQVDAVGDAAENKFDEKANLVDKLGTDANKAIENQAKKVEALGSQTDMAEDNASKMVDKIGHHLTSPTKRNGPDKVEPSKVVVFPDSAVRGTDTSNMQIKEFHPKGGKAKWLAVHIPDHMPYPRRNVKIIASTKAAKDLQRVVGPNKDSLAMEIQSILGVNEDTLHRMIVQGQNDEVDKEEDDDDVDDSENDDDNDDDDSDDIGDPLDNGETSEDCGNSDNLEDKMGKKVDLSTKLRHGKVCNKKKKTKKKIYDGSGIADLLNEEEKPKLHVEQPEGFELRWEDILNNFKNFDVKRKRKICKLFELQNDVCQSVTRRRKHSFKKKLKHYLLRMLRKFLKKNKNDFEDYLSTKLKDALSGRLKPSDDGLLHIYDKNSGNMNMEDFLKDLNDGTPPQLGGGGESRLPLSQTTANPDALTMDETTLNSGVFRVTPQMNTNRLAAEEDLDDSPPAAVSALNNIIHPLLNDQDNKLDEKLQTKILQEELRHVNSEQEEQERQRKKDAALNDRLMYMFQLQNLASNKGDATAPNGEIGGQSISVISPHQISLMQMELPDKNPDIPLVGTSSSKPAMRHARSRSRTGLLGLRRRLPYRPRLLGSFRVRNVNGRWRPTMGRFWKRSFINSKKQKERKRRHLRHIGRKKSKRKLLIPNISHR